MALVAANMLGVMWRDGALNWVQRAGGPIFLERGHFTISLLSRPLFGSELDEISAHGGRQLGFGVTAVESVQL